MQVPTFEDVAALICRQTNLVAPVTEATVVQSDLGVYGDDLDELLWAYADRFGVDMAGYLWYFHNCEEGSNFGALFFAPPYKRVRGIPITVGTLHRFAVLRRWALDYPPHDVPRSRPDIRINQGCALLGLLFVLWALLGALGF
jgi:hypothetical protein